VISITPAAPSFDYLEPRVEQFASRRAGPGGVDRLMFELPDQFARFSRGDSGVARRHLGQRIAVRDRRFGAAPFQGLRQAGHACVAWRLSLWLSRRMWCRFARTRGVPMKFESNAAWQFAVRKVAANRDLLVAVAGVFFVLPSFGLSLLTPEFTPSADADPQARFQQVMEFYSGLMPYAILLGAVQLLGAMAVLALLTDRGRPTVGEALRLGVRGVLPCLGAQLIVAAGLGIGLTLLLLIGAATGIPAVATTLFILGFALAAWAWTRFSLTLPVIAVDRLNNPIAALARSWRLTRGNAGRLFVFYLLLLLVFVIVLSLIMLLIGVVLALAVSEETGKVAADLIAAVLTGVVALYFLGALAGAHRQLSGVED
jgi:hypothetical protein